MSDTGRKMDRQPIVGHMMAWLLGAWFSSPPRFPRVRCSPELWPEHIRAHAWTEIARIL